MNGEGMNEDGWSVNRKGYGRWSTATGGDGRNGDDLGGDMALGEQGRECGDNLILEIAGDGYSADVEREAGLEEGVGTKEKNRQKANRADRTMEVRM
jgi:hypothetical protein